MKTTQIDFQQALAQFKLHEKEFSKLKEEAECLRAENKALRVKVAELSEKVERPLDIVFKQPPLEIPQDPELVLSKSV